MFIIRPAERISFSSRSLPSSSSSFGSLGGALTDSLLCRGWAAVAIDRRFAVTSLVPPTEAASSAAATSTASFSSLSSPQTVKDRIASSRFLGPSSSSATAATYSALRARRLLTNDGSMIRRRSDSRRDLLRQSPCGNDTYNRLLDDFSPSLFRRHSRGSSHILLHTRTFSTSSGTPLFSSLKQAEIQEYIASLDAEGRHLLAQELAAAREAESAESITPRPSFSELRSVCGHR